MRFCVIGLAVLAGLFGAAGVGLAAVGAHVSGVHVSGGPTVTSAADFLLFHAAALIGLCCVAADRRGRAVLVAACVIAIGTILFSGEIALHALTGFAEFRAAAPVGGTLMIAGWLTAAIALPMILGKSSSWR